MVFTTGQQLALAIWPKITGSLSILGSSLIVFEIFRSPVKRSQVFHRILLTMSICDVIASFWLFMSTWPIPVGTTGVWNPSGNQQSCSAQGFFVQVGIGTPLLNAMLSLYYLLVVKYNWTETDLKKAEKYFLGGPILWASCTAIAGLCLQLYNNANLWCWIAPLPEGCSGDGEIPCERGHDALILRFAFYYVPVYICLLFTVVAMWMTWDEVRMTERLAQNDPSWQGRTHSRQVAVQALFYLVAFYCALFPAALTRFLQSRGASVPYGVITFMAITLPGQGSLNYLVYFRPKWIAYRNKHPDWSVWTSLAMLCSRRDPRGAKNGDEPGFDTESPTQAVGSRESVLEGDGTAEINRVDPHGTLEAQSIFATKVEKCINQVSGLESIVNKKIKELAEKEETFDQGNKTALKMLQLMTKCIDRVACLEQLVNDTIINGKNQGAVGEESVSPGEFDGTDDQGEEDLAIALRLSVEDAKARSQWLLEDEPATTKTARSNETSVADHGSTASGVPQVHLGPAFRIEMVPGTNTFRIVTDSEVVPSNPHQLEVTEVVPCKLSKSPPVAPSHEGNRQDGVTNGEVVPSSPPRQELTQGPLVAAKRSGLSSSEDALSVPRQQKLPKSPPRVAATGRGDNHLVRASPSKQPMNRPGAEDTSRGGSELKMPIMKSALAGLKSDESELQLKVAAVAGLKSDVSEDDVTV